eukprot:2164909-Pleurochrysis_carterae.AAC.1
MGSTHNISTQAKYRVCIGSERRVASVCLDGRAGSWVAPSENAPCSTTVDAFFWAASTFAFASATKPRRGGAPLVAWCSAMRPLCLCSPVRCRWSPSEGWGDAGGPDRICFAVISVFSRRLSKPVDTRPKSRKNGQRACSTRSYHIMK